MENETPVEESTRKPIPVPVEAAKRVAHAFEKSYVVIAAYDPEFKLVCRATYGITAEDKIMARLFGDAMMASAGVPNQIHSFADYRDELDAARYKEATEILEKIHGFRVVTWETMAQIDRWIEGKPTDAPRQEGD